MRYADFNFVSGSKRKKKIFQEDLENTANGLGFPQSSPKDYPSYSEQVLGAYCGDKPLKCETWVMSQPYFGGYLTHQRSYIGSDGGDLLS